MSDKLNLQAILKNRLTKNEVVILTDLVCQNHELFEELIDLIISAKNINILSSTWIMGYAGVKKPEWFLIKLNSLYESLTSKTDNSVYRNISRVLMRIKIPKKYSGIVTKYSIEWLSNSNMPIAVRAFCMHILSKIIEHEPSLSGEIKDIIESILINASPGLQNAGNKLIKKINKMGY